MKVPFFDLKPQFEAIGTEIRTALDEVFKTQQFILGPEVEQLERSLADYCNSKHGLGVASGSDALLLSLMVLDVGPGDEVLLPSFTFFATAGAISRLGATPVFVDIDPITYNIAPSLIEQKITPKTKAIIPVHLYGQCADMDPLLDITRRHHIPVIEDAAQAIGAEYRPLPGTEGRKAGQMGDLGCFSFFPTKNLGAFGDAGMIVTDDARLAERVKVLRVHGSQPKYHHHAIGINSRLDTIQAAILMVKLKYLKKWTAERQRKAAKYQALLKELPARIPGFKLPVTQGANRHIFHQYVIQLPRRDALREFLAKEGIGTEIYYPIPLHLQECFRFLKYRPGDLPVSEKASRETLALPIFPEMTDEQQWFVVDRLLSFFTG